MCRWFFTSSSFDHVSCSNVHSISFVRFVFISFTGNYSRNLICWKTTEDGIKLIIMNKISRIPFCHFSFFQVTIFPCRYSWNYIDAHVEKGIQRFISQKVWNFQYSCTAMGPILLKKATLLKYGSKGECCGYPGQPKEPTLRFRINGLY